MPAPKLLDQVRTIARVKHFSLNTERAYVSWIRRFILFHHKQHPKQMAETEIRQFISDLAVNAKISASTQTVALSALLFLYRDVLKRDLPYIDNIERAKPSKKLPVVFTRREIEAVLVRLSGTHHLIACLLYGSGLRLMEAVRLRVKDVDFERHELRILPRIRGASTDLPILLGAGMRGVTNRQVESSIRRCRARFCNETSLTRHSPLSPSCNTPLWRCKAQRPALTCADIAVSFPGSLRSWKPNG